MERPPSAAQYQAELSLKLCPAASSMLADLLRRTAPLGDETALQPAVAGSLAQGDGAYHVTQALVAVGSGVQLARGRRDMAQGDHPRARAEAGDGAGELLGEALLDLRQRQGPQPFAVEALRPFDEGRRGDASTTARPGNDASPSNRNAPATRARPPRQGDAVATLATGSGTPAPCPPPRYAAPARRRRRTPRARWPHASSRARAPARSPAAPAGCCAGCCLPAPAARSTAGVARVARRRGAARRRWRRP